MRVSLEPSGATLCDFLVLLDILFILLAASMAILQEKSAPPDLTKNALITCAAVDGAVVVFILVLVLGCFRPVAWAARSTYKIQFSKSIANRLFKNEEKEWHRGKQSIKLSNTNTELLEDKAMQQTNATLSSILKVLNKLERRSIRRRSERTWRLIRT
jgi:hypothetical protein